MPEDFHSGNCDIDPNEAFTARTSAEAVTAVPQAMETTLSAAVTDASQAGDADEVTDVVTTDSKRKLLRPELLTTHLSL